MSLAKLIGPDLEEAITRGPAAIREAVSEFHPEDIAELVEDLSAPKAVALVRSLTPEDAADIVERLSAARQVLVFHAIDTPRAVALLREMDPDDRVDLLQELPEEEAALLLAELTREEPQAAEEVRELVAYGPETAGGLMTTEFVALPPTTANWEAIEEARRLGREDLAETLYYLYVCDVENRLLGVVSLRDLLLSEPKESLASIMTAQIFAVSPFDDQEKVAHAIARYDLAAIPVVDADGKMLGVVTVDDLVDVVIEEATEDAQKMGGVVPLEESYFDTSLREFVWKRGTWLLVLFLAQMLTITVMERNEALLSSMAALMVFIPLIISTGGNTGSQSATLIIRAMAVGELKPADWRKVVWRELAIGLSLGLLLCVVGFIRAWLVAGSEVEPARLGIAVALSIVSVVTMASMIGALLPLFIRRIGLDPAVSSTPFIASLLDVLGLLVYFAVARWVLHWML